MKIKDRSGEHSPIFLRALALSNERYHEDLDKFLKNYPEPFDLQISVTSLNKPPQERQLVARNWDKIEIDPMDNYYTLFGSGVHNVLENASAEGEQVEVRKGFVAKILGKRVLIHGQADYYNPHTGILEDHKYTSAWTVTKDKDEHVAQLNILGYIWRRDELPVEELYNNYMFRDWQEKFLGTSGYPQEKALWQQVPLWNDAKCKEYILERAKVHIQASFLASDQLPKCTPEERWWAGVTYRVDYKTQKGEWSKKPRICRSESELAALRIKYKDIKVTKDMGEPKKCLKYCLGASFCFQHAQYLNQVKQNG